MNPYIDAYKKSADDRKVKKRRNFFSTSVLAFFFLLGVSFIMVYKHTLGHQLLHEVQSLNIEKDKLGVVSKYSITPRGSHGLVQDA